jgi:hypothetical protein
MIRLLVGIVVRAFVEIALVLFVFAGIFVFVAYRTARRFATTEPDRFDKLAGTLSTALGIAAGRSARAHADDELDDDDLAVSVGGWDVGAENGRNTVA